VSIGRILNRVRGEAIAAADAHRQHTRIGIVSGFDPVRYCAKVRLQPEPPDQPAGSTETGWLPVLALWGGNGWGLFCPPSPGDVVEVQFQEGGREAGIVLGRFFSTVTQPLPAPSGEFWLVHQSGSKLKFHNDGSVELAAATNLTITAGQTLRLAGADIQIHATNSYRWDVNGHGQHWTPTSVNTWQTGETAGTTNPISPPEIG